MIRIEFESIEKPLPVKAVRTELRQVFLNIFRNAYEAIEDEGLIRIRAKSEMRDTGSDVVVTISDTGPGIDSKISNDIFLPFYSSKSGRRPNMGLGLSISFSILKKHGGTLELRNLPQGGCEVSIRMPMVLNDSA